MNRRILTTSGVAVVLVVAVLVIVAWRPWSSPTAAHRSPSGTGTLAGAAAASASPPSLRPAPPPDSPSAAASTGSATVDCTAADVSIAQQASNSGAAGSIVAVISIANRTDHPCALRGYPRFTLADATGAPLSAPITHGGSGPPALSAVPGQVTVAAGGTAGFLLSYANRPDSGGGSCASATQLRLDTGHGAATGAVTIAVCGPATHVSPYLPIDRLNGTS